MPNQRIMIAGAGLVAITGLAAVAWYHLPPRPSDDSEAGSRLPQLKELVEQQERESGEAVAAYLPTATARLDNLTAPPGEILRPLPGISNVEVAVQADKPAHRIIHLRDWHFVPRDLFAFDVQHAASRPLSAEEIDRLYEESLLEVEVVQIEQLALLRCLIQHHGLQRIRCEGLPDKDLPTFQEKIAILRTIEQEKIP